MWLFPLIRCFSSLNVILLWNLNKTGGPDNRTYFLKFSIYPGHLILRVFSSFFNSIIFINFGKTFLEILIFFSLFILNEGHYSTLKGLRDLNPLKFLTPFFYLIVFLNFFLIYFSYFSHLFLVLVQESVFIRIY